MQRMRSAQRDGGASVLARATVHLAVLQGTEVVHLEILRPRDLQRTLGARPPATGP
jgi:hypothetical protein